ncbi:hypothetical protein GWI33_014516 [Rhynchophorus ferrugineus]|uniref:Uncharacterized protein n=1 Tax=Rhynchophorus ferrugineus TaxID=354439 RepID=A0A834M6U2_RHYFE|nr:hypothetical protein GWI33_014516 [Rhynchophorus ferrugineus]
MLELAKKREESHLFRPIRMSKGDLDIPEITEKEQACNRCSKKHYGKECGSANIRFINCERSGLKDQQTIRCSVYITAAQRYCNRLLSPVFSHPPPLGRRPGDEPLNR